MKNPNKLLRVGVIGIALVALCCFTPILVILLGAIGLAAFTGYLDYVLLPALAVFIGLTLYAIWRNKPYSACDKESFPKTKESRNER
ncbi:mercury resistance system transport protein MerF [Marinobacter fonticola]|uniref:mercury resistance system transport protein MerF n=1 Tax=Marinobacter fonticola TaxID=2603215 RepID=UPI0011E792DC|nr:mercury resistance system transport protein MerF [Marinobacter fonticola]